MRYPWNLQAQTRELPQGPIELPKLRGTRTDAQ